eukprot:scaffold1175_cov24-Tisochrysis_lutea.AAC.1
MIPFKTEQQYTDSALMPLYRRPLFLVPCETVREAQHTNTVAYSVSIPFFWYPERQCARHSRPSALQAAAAASGMLDFVNRANTIIPRLTNQKGLMCDSYQQSIATLSPV